MQIVVHSADHRRQARCPARGCPPGPSRCSCHSSRLPWELGLPTERNRASLFKYSRTEVSRLCAENRLRPVLTVDEAHHRVVMIDLYRRFEALAIDPALRVTIERPEDYFDLVRTRLWGTPHPL